MNIIFRVQLLFCEQATVSGAAVLAASVGIRNLQETMYGSRG
ncbi:hypothetical protein SLEP1_g31831 [Rubroshorea leprosula]|uniref:Uncharacterized protein n=1 Tax=Rubroshorea leprosula TaxID=152421 RepID=A0AAV5KBF0_9ROSI|nr:hypothetical protein SLEP1_g31831 [Rubroshorea leprosula]